MSNCPNCGAPIDGPQCSYCGTVHCSNADLARLASGKPAALTFTTDEGYEVKLMIFVNSLSFDYDFTHLYDYDHTIVKSFLNSTTVSITGAMIN